MFAIFRKELRCYKATMLGYVFAAFLLAAVGLYFSFTNLNLASPRFEAVLKSVQFVFLAFVPILTMRVFAEERRQRTDTLLMTVPLRKWQIVGGKYLALLTVFSLPMAIICLYPWILCRYGKVNLPAAYSSILGFYLLGAACLSIGVFCSCVTDSPVIAAVLSFSVLLITYVADTAAKMVPYTAKASLAAAAGIGVLAGAGIWRAGRHAAGGIAAAAVLAGTAAAVYHFRPSLLEGRFQWLVGVFYLNGRLDGFADGILDMRAAGYYLGITLTVLFLTARRLENQKGVCQRLPFDIPYRILTAALFLAGVLLANGILRKLPASMTQWDLTGTGIYTLTEETEKYLKETDRDLTLTLVCEGGEEDAMVLRLLERFEEAGGGHLHIARVDPVLYPGFVSRYTEGRLANNSVILTCGEESRVIAAEDFYTVGTSRVTGRKAYTSFAGENLVMQAVQSVLSGEKPVFYALCANGEAELPEEYLEAAANQNIDIKPLNLLTREAVPEDAAGLLLPAPATDYSRESADKILTYLEAGGKAAVFTDFSLEEMPQTDRILADYGMIRLPGIVLEGDSSRYISYQYCLLPEIAYSAVTKEVYGSYLLTPMAQAVKTAPACRDSVTLIPLLTTSQASYNKADVETMTTSEKEPGDESGPFTIGVLAQEDSNKDGEADTELIFISTGYFLDGDFNQSVSGTNAKFLGEILGYLAGEEAGTLVIPQRSLEDAKLAIPEFDANAWTVVCVFALPLLIVGGGACNQLRRRRRRS